jgi:hypothetical protein
MAMDVNMIRDRVAGSQKIKKAKFCHKLVKKDQILKESLPKYYFPQD